MSIPIVRPTDRARPGRRRPGLAHLGDGLFRGLCQSSAGLVIVLLLLLVVLLTLQAWPAVRTLGLGFLTRSAWDTTEPDPENFGALTFLYGTAVTAFLAMLIAVPLGVGTAAFLSEISPAWLRRGGSFLVELLAAIPSVVYGFWGLLVLAPFVQDVFNHMGGPNYGGKGILSAGLILAVMVLPYITAVSYDVCQAVPRSQREAALALGATRWQMISKVVLPYARPGIVGGCFLGLGRALGETMAVTMLIGNSAVIEALPFGRGYTIPSVIANELYAPNNDLHRATLIELGLLLFLVTVVFNSLARLLIWRVGRVGTGRSLLAFRGRRPVAPPPPQPEPPPGPRPRTSEMRRLSWWVNHAMTGVLALCLAISLGPLFLILGYIARRGFTSLNWDFFVHLPRPMNESGGGMANALVGTGMLVLLATLFAFPFAMLAAIFLAEYRAHRFAPVVRFVGELLNGVPSIVVGTFVYALLNVLIQAKLVAPSHRFSGWAGALALGVMMIPIVMRTSEEALKLVPQSLRNASYALGAFHWQTVIRVTVPAALPAIITGLFLAIARIAGETAPLLMTAFGNTGWARSPADKTPALPLYIYKYSMSGYGEWERQAWAAALVLVALVMLLNVGIRFLTGRRVVLASRAD